MKLFPRDTGLLLKQAQVLDLLGRFADANNIFQRLLVVDPMFGNVYAYYGLHWQLQKRIKPAELCSGSRSDWAKRISPAAACRTSND
ncbi:MAG: hypothetical protein WDN28_21030 [Chthoniobacter sp.]